MSEVNKIMERNLGRLYCSMVDVMNELNNHLPAVNIYSKQIQNTEEPISTDLLEEIQFRIENINYLRIKFATELMNAAIEDIIEMRIDE